MDPKRHWEDVHAESAADDVSWYTPGPGRSLAFLDAAGATPASRVLDVGCGISGLAEHLVARGFRDVTALDVSGAALRRARERLGANANAVTWVEADVLEFVSEHPFDVWHDRAVFHFLTTPADQRRYVTVLEQAVKPGGHVILATFAPDGPEQCSGLPVQRYDADALAHTLGSAFELVKHEREDHVTPWDTMQKFQWAMFRKRP